MQTRILPIQTRQGQVYLPVKFALTFTQRLKGFMFTKPTPDYGILFPNTRQIHMFFMRFPLDVYYLDQAGKIIYADSMEPWKIGPNIREAHYVLEFPQGLYPLQAGDHVILHAPKTAY
ncbi:DUF192 domain-containing protein [Cytobacillus sp. FJAT-54145]|uniref:DUF192 domain-containing protein n=1 Tax=Cytobacillus spartinae TaxID=3299023 RepID=A0ABW6KAH5_9BACI